MNCNLFAIPFRSIEIPTHIAKVNETNSDRNSFWKFVKKVFSMVFQNMQKSMTIILNITVKIVTVTLPLVFIMFGIFVMFMRCSVH